VASAAVLRLRLVLSEKFDTAVRTTPEIESYVPHDSLIWAVLRYVGSADKYTTTGRGVLNVTQSLSSPARHLGEEKKGYSLKPLSKRTMAPPKQTTLDRALQKGCSQAVANELAGFNTQEFRLAAVS
jgi:hypothetical protein